MKPEAGVSGQHAKKGAKKGLEYLRTLEYIPEAHIDFFERITRVHKKAMKHLAKDRVYPSITKKTAQEMLSKGFPLINFDRMRIKIRPLRVHFDQICSLLKRFEKSDPKEITTFSKSKEYKKLDVKQLIRKTLSSDAGYLDSVSKRIGVDQTTLKLIAISLAKPLLELAANEVQDRIKDDSWWQNFCPVCGSEPLMAKISRKEKHRILVCSLCGTEWKFSRVKCPFCNNENQKDLKFFYYHDKSPYRLYVCDKCRRYIKSVDERKIGVGRKISVLFEDMATLYLDSLAQEKGYQSSWLSNQKQ